MGFCEMADEMNMGTGKLDVAFVPEPGVISDGNTGGAANLGASSMASDTSGEDSGTAAKAASAAKNLGSQATDHIRTLADTGKSKATGALSEFAKMLDDAAVQVDEKLGSQFGGYARQASGAVQSFADGLDGKEIDDIVDDVRVFVQKSPTVAIGTAAALGFVVARVLRAGVDANRA
jgi:ElaB/YqjD/DUF883 family membrane-anchored ribosome-binding protein